MNDMNNVNTYPMLTLWCEKYHEKSGLKVHPSSVPVDLVLEDLLQRFSRLNEVAHILAEYAKVAGDSINKLNERVALLENPEEPRKKEKVKK